jgi:hypothetical protein
MLVPSSGRTPDCVVLAAARIPIPGAATSGFGRPSRVLP